MGMEDCCLSFHLTLEKQDYTAKRYLFSIYKKLYQVRLRPLDKKPLQGANHFLLYPLQFKRFTGAIRSDM
jgi:hypothetical protein